MNVNFLNISERQKAFPPRLSATCASRKLHRWSEKNATDEARPACAFFASSFYFIFRFVPLLSPSESSRREQKSDIMQIQYNSCILSWFRFAFRMMYSTAVYAQCMLSLEVRTSKVNRYNTTSGSFGIISKRYRAPPRPTWQIKILKSKSIRWDRFFMRKHTVECAICRPSGR